MEASAVAFSCGRTSGSDEAEGLHVHFSFAMVMFMSMSSRFAEVLHRNLSSLLLLALLCTILTSWY
jgi:hypothetical protein